MSGAARGGFVGREHQFPVRVYYEDTDFSGFVYHANFVKFFERGRSEALRAAGVSHRDLLGWEPPAAMVVRRMAVEYLRPAQIEDELLVCSGFESARGARITVRQRIERDGVVLATAEVEAALIGLDGRPRKIPREFVHKLAAWLSGAAP